MANEPLKIDPGTYKLVCTGTIENPKPDRRSKDWYKRERWASGGYYVVFGDAEVPLVDDETLATLPEDECAKLAGKTKRSPYQRIQRVGERHFDYIAVGDVERWNALVPHLVPVNEADEPWEAFLMRVFDRASSINSDFMHWLVLRGYINRQELASELAIFEEAPTDWEATQVLAHAKRIRSIKRGIIADVAGALRDRADQLEAMVVDEIKQELENDGG